MVDDVTVNSQYSQDNERSGNKWETQWQQIKENKTREAKPNTVNSKLKT